MKEYKFDMPDSKKCGLILEDADALVRIGSYRNHGMIAKDIGLGIVLHQDNRGEMKRNVPERWLDSVKFI